MPLLEYRCRTCRERFEWLKSGPDDLPSRCPGCGAEDLARELSVFATPSARQKPGPCGSEDCACRRAAEA